MEIFETIFAVGLVGFSLSFALVMYLEAKDSIENKIANVLGIGFFITFVIGVIGVLL